MMISKLQHRIQLLINLLILLRAIAALGDCAVSILLFSATTIYLFSISSQIRSLNEVRVCQKELVLICT
ncbi:hypothetical protein [Chlorogloeopsis fritschii]|jgi:hypothetical protein|uniref:hypothetical protein n=1 Tax=Chlorogloeopsis fritschii TaxID=1124 RepID=UPI00047512CF|nr:hypothetical protein [Chlorogloeopsis fritschii]